MFTGIVEELGKVISASPHSLTVESKVVRRTLNIGGSVSVNGACLTATRLGPDFFEVELMPETLRQTATSLLRRGDLVNLESPLTPDKPLGGHFVQGHVDGTGLIKSIFGDGEIIFSIEAGEDILRYVVKKGFVAVDGISLTVVERAENYFTVSLVRYTVENTTMGLKKIGHKVNIEVDVLAKYVERLVKPSPGLSLEFLMENGF
jgi:riboflavin synthase